jgi:hypothetical protein
LDLLLDDRPRPSNTAAVRLAAEDTAANVVSRVTEFGNGVQVEQPEGVRKDARARDAVALAVADVYLRQGDA